MNEIKRYQKANFGHPFYWKRIWNGEKQRENVNVNVIYLLSTIIKHYKAACTINELDSKAALLHLQLPTN